MIVGIVFGVIGCLIAIFALKCLKMGNMEDNVKATMTLTAGILFLLAGTVKFAVSGSVFAAESFCTNITAFSLSLGVCGIAGVSAFANLIVQSFRFTTFADGGYNLLGGSDIGGLSGNLTPR